jgi:hypothetical protein
MDRSNRKVEAVMARQRDEYDDHDDAGWFRDQLRQRDRELAELRREKDELTDLICRFDEYVAEINAALETWQQAFDMELDDDGKWSLGSWWDRHSDLVDRYNALVRRWNRPVPLVDERDVGRLLKADEEEVAAVERMHKEGMSLRAIAEEMELGVNTVRTVVGRINRSDRTTKKRCPRELAHQKSQKRTAAALPKRMQAAIETGTELVKEAKGLGRAR